MSKSRSEKLPTLVDKDIVSHNVARNRRLLSRGKLTTVGIALSMATIAIGCKPGDAKHSYDTSDVSLADTSTDASNIPATIHTDNTGDASGPGTDQD